MVLHQDNNIAYWVCVCNEVDFLTIARRYYSEKKNTYYYNTDHQEWFYDSYRDDKIILQWLFKLGKDYNVLTLDYKQFAEEITAGYRNYYYKPKKNKWSRYLEERHGKYLEGTKYRKNTDHQKKEKVEDTWRDKYFYKDKAKSKFRRHLKGLKEETRSSHRAWEKQMIHQERWDDLSKDNKSWVSIVDPWSYD